jgi:hypothetical protein
MYVVACEPSWSEISWEGVVIQLNHLSILFYVYRKIRVETRSKYRFVSSVSVYLLSAFITQ